MHRAGRTALSAARANETAESAIVASTSYQD
jgi:hypothetical protein